MAVSERVVLLLVTGMAGGALAKRVKMPGGSLLGAMLATGAVSLAASDSQPLPEMFRSAALLLLGIYIGSSMQRDRLMRMRHVLPAALIAILVFIAVGTGLGWVLHRHFAPDISLVTALLGTMPGGASGLTAVAYDLGAEPRLVASLHMVRLMIVFGLLPLVLRRLARPLQGDHSDDQ